MYNGERPMGAAKGKQTKRQTNQHYGLVPHAPPPPQCLAQCEQWDHLSQTLTLTDRQVA